MSDKKTSSKASIENIYLLDGKVPFWRSIPFGLQHVLAMFVANIAPIMIVAAASGLTTKDTASLIQTAMIVAGIGTLVQLFTIWRIGAKLPIVMGISFTFVSVFCYVAPKWGYGAVIGAVLIGGVIEAVLGFFAKYWRKIIAPIVSACVVTAIGFSLLSVGANSFAGGTGAGVSVQPVGFLVVGEDGVKMLPAQTNGAVERVVELLPQLLEDIGSSSGQKKKTKTACGGFDTMEEETIQP